MTGPVTKDPRIKLAAFDVDGVMTDGTLLYGANGEEVKAFNAQDGVGFSQLRRAGIEIAVISGRSCPALERRLDDLQVGHRALGVHDKVAALDDILNSLQIDWTAISFMGDDLIDLSAMRRAGVAIAPANAVAVVRDDADLVTAQPGGQGAVREACDHILALNGMDPLALYDGGLTQ